jgi:putative tryptophan/tyrosine transport system substrate-binding protein
MRINHLRRRELIALLGGAAVAWPLAARAQQPAMPVIGFLSPRTATDTVGLAAAFRQALNEGGYIDGRNVAIEYRWAANQVDQLPALAAELVGRPATVIAAFSTVGVLAAKAATTTIPIVFNTADDPVKAGIVASLARPGGNVTGITFVSAMLGAKRLQLLRALAPKTGLIAMLVDPNSPESVNQSQTVQDAARALGQQLAVLNAGTPSEIDLAFASLVQQRADALLLSGSPSFTTWRDQIIALAARHRVPTMYQFREFPAAGGLISYGASISDAYRQTGIYVGRILRGDKPAELPVLQPTRFELVINLKTVTALGLDLPPTLLALADEVIE